MNATAPDRQPIRWIVSPAYDLGFFVASGALTFVFWGLYEALKAYGMAPDGLAVLITYGLFTCLLDLPHIFQTFARTHADPDEYARRKGLYTWGLPLLMLAGLAIPALGWDGYFVAGMAMYGSYHIVRQHVGLVRVYQGLNEAKDLSDRWLDRAAVELGLFACVLYDYAGEAARQVVVYGGLKATFPVLPEPLVAVVCAAAWLAVAAFGARQLQRLAQGLPVNWPKVALVGMALTTHYTIFVLATVPFLVAEAIETAYHDVQYHGWSMMFQRRRFPAIRGVAGKWLLAALAYGLVAGLIETVGYTNNLCYWLFAPIGMLTLFHYYIDGKIWRTRECPELRPLLYGAPPAPAPAPAPVAGAR